MCDCPSFRSLVMKNNKFLVSKQLLIRVSYLQLNESYIILKDHFSSMDKLFKYISLSSSLVLKLVMYQPFFYIPFFFPGHAHYIWEILTRYRKLNYFYTVQKFYHGYHHYYSLITSDSLQNY